VALEAVFIVQATLNHSMMILPYLTLPYFTLGVGRLLHLPSAGWWL